MCCAKEDTRYKKNPRRGASMKRHDDRKPWSKWWLSRAVHLCLVLLGLAARGCFPTRVRAAMASQRERAPRRVTWEDLLESSLQVVDGLQISLRAEAVPDENDIAVPYGREIRLRFEAFGERFDARLSIQDDGGTGANSRVRAVGAGGEVIVERGPRRCTTYAGWLPHGGWVRAVVRSATSATVHFLHKGEIHSLEPVYGWRGQKTATDVSGAANDVVAGTLRAQNVPPGNALTHSEDSTADEDGRKEEHGKGYLKGMPRQAANSARFTAAAAARLDSHAHVAYRRSDLLPSVSPRSLGSAAARLSPAEASVMMANGGESANEKGENWAKLGSHEERNEGSRSHRIDRRRSDDRRLTSEQLEGNTSNNNNTETAEETFRMPATVESGVGGTWDDGPFGPIGMCPSSPKVFEVGIAVDAGFFKAATGYGADQSGNNYGQRKVTLEDAIDIAVSDIEGMINLVNVLYTDQLRLFIDVKHIEIRTEAAIDAGGGGGQSESSLEESWNQEPLDHTRHRGTGRLEYGCPNSREKGASTNGQQFMSTSTDHFATLEGFAAWRASLPTSERLGLWILLTACYEEGVEGLTYIGSACSDDMGVGWVSRRPYGTWEVMAHEIGHALGGSDFLDLTKDVMRASGRWNDFALLRDESREEICDFILAHDECFEPFTPTCGNSIVEPGEECDDDSPCCIPDACKLVPNAKCSQGPLWAEDVSSRINGTTTSAAAGLGEGWTGQCCSEECQFLSSATLCQIPGGGGHGVCGNGGCRRMHMPTINYWSYEACVSPESPDFNPCVSHYVPIRHEWPSASDQGGGATMSSDDVTDDVTDDDDDDDDEAEECLQEERYPFPAGIVCDHENYKECNAEAVCTPMSPPKAAEKRNVTRNHEPADQGVEGLDVEFPAPGGAFSDGEDSEEQQDVGGVSNGTFSIALVYRGCFNDGLFSNDLQGGTKVFHDLTILTCGEWCLARGHSVMGLQNGRLCTCGDRFGGPSHPPAGEDECNVRCKGDLSQKCGAFAKKSIYRILSHEEDASLGLTNNENDEDAVGQQGSGFMAGSRIRWRRSGAPGTTGVPEYYGDANETEAGNGVSYRLNYLGCFRDHPGRLREFHGSEGGRESGDAVYVFPRSLTPHVCENRCRAMGMPFFGLQFGRECRCGERPPRLAPAANCVSPCSGDRTYVCGGAWANTVYHIAGLGGETPELLLPKKPRESAGSSAFQYLGCFADGDTRDLNGTTSVSVEQRPRLCGVFCQSLGYPFFGVGWSRECSCGDSYGSLGPSNSCNYPCVGSPTVTCGGPWSSSVYAISSDESTAPALTPSTAALPSSSPTASPAGGGGVVRTPIHGSEDDPGRRRELSRIEAEYPIPPSTNASIVTRGTPRVEVPMRRSLGEERRRATLETTPSVAALPMEVFHPLGGELLTTGTISTVMWQVKTEWRDAVEAAGNISTESIDLWLVAASGDDAEVARMIDGNCSPFPDGAVCEHVFIVPDGGEGSTLELRASPGSRLLGRSKRFSIKSQTSFAFKTPRQGLIPVRGGVMTISWESTGSARNVWIALHDAETGAVAATIGATRNTGSVQWVVPRRVQEGVYYLVIRPLKGGRMAEKQAASEIFRVASPSTSSISRLAFVTPVGAEYVDTGETVRVTWTSPDIDRVRVILQNEQKWDVETVVYEGANDNGFVWEVPSSLRPGVSYYFQLENPDENDREKLGPDVIGGLGESEFDLLDHLGVRTRPFTVTSQQPAVSIGNIFRGQTGEAWTKGFSIELELVSSAKGPDGVELPVKLELMQGGAPVWTLPGSPGLGPIFQTRLPGMEPADGVYSLRATSLLHPQAFVVSHEFEVTSYVPEEWGGVSSSLTLEGDPLSGSVLEHGKSYEIRWTSSFVGRVKVELRREEGPLSPSTVIDPIPLEGSHSLPNTGSFWLAVPFDFDEDSAWCGGPFSSEPAGPEARGEIASTLGEEAPDNTTDSTSNRRSGSTDDPEADSECCFTLTVSDVHNMDVFDTTGKFCVDHWTVESEGVDRGTYAGPGGAESNVTLEVTMFSETEWQKGLVKEIRWVSKGLTKPVSVSIIGSDRLETTASRGKHDWGDDDQAERVSSEDQAVVVGGQRLELGIDLPTAGSITATVEPGAIGLPAGHSYRIEVLDATGDAKGLSPPFRLVDPPGITLQEDDTTLGGITEKGDTRRVVWEFADKSFPVRVQLLRRLPTPVALEGRYCILFKADDGRWEPGCVQDPGSPLYLQCATEIDDSNSAPLRTEYCTESAGYIKLIWQSEEIAPEERSIDVAIPREETELPSMGPDYFWRVVSTADPHVHSESRSFFVGYPATFISFRTSGATLEGVAVDIATTLMHAVERSLGLQRGRLKLWALNGNRYPGNDDGAEGFQDRGGNIDSDVTSHPTTTMSNTDYENDSLNSTASRGAHGRGHRQRERSLAAGSSGDNATRRNPTNGDESAASRNDDVREIEGGSRGEGVDQSGEAVADSARLTVVVTLEVSPTSSSEQLTPLQIVGIMGFLCELHLLVDDLPELGNVECESITVRDSSTESDSYSAGYSSILNRTRKDGDGFLQSEAFRIGIMVCVIIAILIVCALAARGRRIRRRKRALFWNNPAGGNSQPRYAHPRDLDSDVISVEGEDSYGQIGSPAGSFAGAFYDDYHGHHHEQRLRVATGENHRRGRPRGFREAASTIVARVLSGVRDPSPSSRSASTTF